MHEILERDRQAVQRAAVVAALALLICRACHRQGVVAIDIDERVQLAVERIDARQAAGDDVLRRGFAGIEAAGEFGQRAVRGIGGHVVDRKVDSVAEHTAWRKHDRKGGILPAIKPPTLPVA